MQFGQHDIASNWNHTEKNPLQVYCARSISNGSDHNAGLEDMFGKMSHVHFHFVAFAYDPDLPRLHLRQPHTLEREGDRLGAEVRLEPATEQSDTGIPTQTNLLCRDVDFRRLPGGVLDHQEQLGDDLDDVAGLEHEVALFLA